jgi:hypothetical protein
MRIGEVVISRPTLFFSDLVGVDPTVALRRQ